MAIDVSSIQNANIATVVHPVEGGGSKELLLGSFKCKLHGGGITGISADSSGMDPKFEGFPRRDQNKCCGTAAGKQKSHGITRSNYDALYCQ